MCLQLLKERKKQHNETEPQIASQLFLPPNLVHEAGGLLFAYHTPAANSGRARKATEQTRYSLSSLSCCSCDRGPGEFAQHDICKCLLASLLAQLENGCWGWRSSSCPPPIQPAQPYHLGRAIWTNFHGSVCSVSLLMTHSGTWSNDPTTAQAGVTHAQQAGGSGCCRSYRFLQWIMVLLDKTGKLQSNHQLHNERAFMCSAAVVVMAASFAQFTFKHKSSTNWFKTTSEWWMLTWKVSSTT